MTTASPAPSKLRFGDLVLLLPLAACLVYIHTFAESFPLTDEWHYTHAIRKLHEIDFGSLAGWREALAIYPTRFNEHLVGFPFLLYWPLAEWGDFDSRWMICLTVAAFAGHVLLFRTRVVATPLATLPVALLVFSPSHYIEFHWGWQVTLAFSIFFPVAALFVLAPLEEASPRRVLLARFLAANACLAAGAFSSAGGLIGFGPAVALLMCRPLAWRTRLLLMAGTASVGLVIYFGFMQAPLHSGQWGWRAVWQIVTAVGAVVWGMPVTLDKFGFEPTSALGLVILACLAAVVFRALRLRQLAAVALPLAVALFGLLCLVPISLARPYLANWHLQHALPAVCGTYGAAWQLSRLDRSGYARVPFLLLALILPATVVAYALGFLVHGPAYATYAQSVVRYFRHDLVAPNQPAPYPRQGANSMTSDLVLFLAGHDQPAFHTAWPSTLLAVPTTMRCYLDDEEILDRRRVRLAPNRTQRLTVVLPSGWIGDRLVGALGGERLVLLRLDGGHSPPAAPHDSKYGYFATVLIPHKYPAGELELVLWQVP